MAKKKPVKKWPHKEPRESFHLPADLQRRLVTFCAKSDPPVTKSAVLVSALTAYLESKGF